MTCVFSQLLLTGPTGTDAKGETSKERSEQQSHYDKTENAVLSSVTAQIVALTLIKPLVSVVILPGARERGFFSTRG